MMTVIQQIQRIIYIYITVHIIYNDIIYSMCLMYNIYIYIYIKYNVMYIVVCNILFYNILYYIWTYHNTSSPLIFGTQNTNHFADGFPTLSLPSCCFPCPHVTKFAFVSAPRVDQWGRASFMKSETTVQKKYVAGEITLWYNPGSMMLVETSPRKGNIPHPKQRQHGWDITH